MTDNSERMHTGTPQKEQNKLRSLWKNLQEFSSQIVIDIPGLTNTKQQQQGTNNSELSDLPAGLVNQGATCYLNALLQCLFWTPEFKERIQKAKRVDSGIIEELQDIFYMLENGQYRVETKKLTDCLKLYGGRQQDIAEIFLLLLKKLDEEVPARKSLKTLYKTTLVTSLKCLECGVVNNTECDLVLIPLALSTSSVNTALEKFLSPRRMEEDNQIYCDGSCQCKTNTYLTYMFTHLPPVLILQLKRFEFIFSSGEFVKHCNMIGIQRILEVDCNHKKIKYELFAICDHYGSRWGGHYVAFIKLQSNRFSGWHEFNDQSVYNIDRKIEYETISSPNAYLLMYKQTQYTLSKYENPTQEHGSPGKTTPTICKSNKMTTNNIDEGSHIQSAVSQGVTQSQHVRKPEGDHRQNAIELEEFHPDDVMGTEGSHIQSAVSLGVTQSQQVREPEEGHPQHVLGLGGVHPKDKIGSKRNHPQNKVGVEHAYTPTTLGPEGAHPQYMEEPEGVLQNVIEEEETHSQEVMEKEKIKPQNKMRTKGMHLQSPGEPVQNVMGLAKTYPHNALGSEGVHPQNSMELESSDMQNTVGLKCVHPQNTVGPEGVQLKNAVGPEAFQMQNEMEPEESPYAEHNEKRSNPLRDYDEIRDNPFYKNSRIKINSSSECSDSRGCSPRRYDGKEGIDLESKVDPQITHSQQTIRPEGANSQNTVELEGTRMQNTIGQDGVHPQNEMGPKGSHLQNTIGQLGREGTHLQNIMRPEEFEMRNAMESEGTLIQITMRKENPLTNMIGLETAHFTNTIRSEETHFQNAMRLEIPHPEDMMGTKGTELQSAVDSRVTQSQHTMGPEGAHPLDRTRSKRNNQHNMMELECGYMQNNIGPEGIHPQKTVGLGGTHLQNTTKPEGVHAQNEMGRKKAHPQNTIGPEGIYLQYNVGPEDFLMQNAIGLEGTPVQSIMRSEIMHSQNVIGSKSDPSINIVGPSGTHLQNAKTLVVVHPENVIGKEETQLQSIMRPKITHPLHVMGPEGAHTQDRMGSKKSHSQNTVGLCVCIRNTMGSERTHPQYMMGTTQYDGTRGCLHSDYNRIRNSPSTIDNGTIESPSECSGAKGECENTRGCSPTKHDENKESSFSAQWN